MAESLVIKVLKKIKKAKRGELFWYQYKDTVIAARTKDELKDFKDALHKSKTPYFESHENKVEGERNGIRLVTFHSIKGLEFKYVFFWCKQSYKSKIVS